MVGVVPHVKMPPDHVRDSLGAPRRVGEPMVDGTLPQEGADLFQLRGGEAGGAAGGDRRLETTRALQTLFPVADSVHGDAEVLGDLPLCMLVPLKPGGRGQPAFFQLGTRVLGRMPFGHAASLSAPTYVVINRGCRAGD